MDNKNLGFNQFGPEREKASYGKKEEGIRTMRSDISEFLKEEKPSVIGLVTKKMGETTAGGTIASGEKRKIPWKIIGIVTSTLIILSALGFAGYYYFFSQEAAVTKKEVEEKKISYISFEEERSILLKNKDEFLPKIKEIANEGVRFGTMQKLNVKISDGGDIRTMTFKDFLRFLDTVPPIDLEFISLPEIQQFIYHTDERPIFVSIIQVSDAKRATADMFSWEPRIFSELNELLLGQTADINIIFFEDKSHDGISYRFAKMSPSRDLGIGYFIHPDKKYLVITTSEEAIRIIINRLLEP